MDNEKKIQQLLHAGNSTIDTDKKDNSCYVLETV